MVREIDFDPSVDLSVDRSNRVGSLLVSVMVTPPMGAGAPKDSDPLDSRFLPTVSWSVIPRPGMFTMTFIAGASWKPGGTSAAKVALPELIGMN